MLEKAVKQEHHKNRQYQENTWGSDNRNRGEQEYD